VRIKYSVYERATSRAGLDREPNLYISSEESTLSVRWAVANLTCHEAQMNSSGYACVSINSTCLGVTNTNKYATKYVGYRCKCKDGFQGNPYIPNGCQGTIYTSSHMPRFDLGQMAHI
jgi:hypothetical protein